MELTLIFTLLPLELYTLIKYYKSLVYIGIRLTFKAFNVQSSIVTRYVNSPISSQL